MGCFPCFDSREEETLNPQKERDDRKEVHPVVPSNMSRLSSGHTLLWADRLKSRGSTGSKRETSGLKDLPGVQIAAHTFTFRELAAATSNFRPESFIGEGGFGRVYKGRLANGQAVAVKQLDRNGLQGNREFLVEARPLFNDRRKFAKLADPRLQGQFPMRGLYQALAVASMCIQEQAAARPLIGDVVTALSYLANQAYDPNAAPGYRFSAAAADKDDKRGARISRNEDGSGGGSGRKWDLDGSEKEDSPRETARMLNRDADRERAVAEAKMWGENFREKRRQNGDLEGSEKDDSPRETVKMLNRDLDRERAVAEAKMWGENFREKRRQNTNGNFDGNNG
nr:serine/threonine-protein kinase PBS1 [Ipomoea trifida]